MVVAVATRLQMNPSPRMPTMIEDSIAQGEPCAFHKGPTNNIGQSRLPLTFGLADVVISSS